MRQVRLLAVNFKALLQNRLMLWGVSGFLILWAPKVLSLVSAHRAPSDLSTVWNLFFADLMAGYLVAYLELSVLARPFSFTVPGNFEIPGLLLILMGVVMNGFSMLWYWPLRMTGVAALNLFSVFMVGNFCFLAPAILSTSLKSARTFVILLIPVQLLPLLVFHYWGMVFQQVIHPAAAIPLGLFAWGLVWSRLRNRTIRRSLVGRTDFEWANIWFNPKKIRSAWEKSQGTSLPDRFMQGLMGRRITAFQVSPVTKGLAGTLYSAVGRFSYRTAITGIGLFLIVILEFYLSGSRLRSTLVDHPGFLVIPLMIASLFATTFPRRFSDLPLSRTTRWKVVLYWNFIRAALTSLIVALSLILLGLLMPGFDLPKLLVWSMMPLYVSPGIMLIELYISHSEFGPLFLLPLLKFMPNPQFWISSWRINLEILIGFWGLLLIAIAWRYQNFDLAGSRSAWSQAWSRRWVRWTVVAGGGLCAVLLYTRPFGQRLSLDERLVSTNGFTCAVAMREYAGLFNAEKEQHIDYLIQVLRRDKYPDRYVAAQVLGKIGWRGQRALPVMIKTLTVTHPNMQWSVLCALYSWGPAARPAAPAVYPLLKHPDKYIRAMAARTLIAMQVPDAGRADIVNELIAGAAYINKDDAAQSIDSLGALGPAAKAALPVLLKDAKSPNPIRPRQTLWAIGRLGIKTPEVREALIRGVRHPDQIVELNALVSLVWVDPDALKSVSEAAATLGRLKSTRVLQGALFYAVFGDAVSAGDLIDIRALIDLGADINAKEPYTGETPLMFAAQAGHADVVRLLLAKGADVSIRSYVQSTDKSGKWVWKTALTYAVETDLQPDTKAEIVKLLKNNNSN